LTSGQQLLLDLNSQTQEVKDYLEELDSDLLERQGVLPGLEAAKELFPEPLSKQLSDVKMSWKSLKPISTHEAEKRLEVSPLITGFSTPIDTLSEIQSELGLMAPNQQPLEDDTDWSDKEY